MTHATSQALEQANRILHEAGWDQTEETNEPSTPADLNRIRHAFQTLLPQDHFAILTQVLKEGRPVEEAGQSLGLDREKAVSLFDEALLRLRDFVGVAEAGRRDPIAGAIAGKTPQSAS